MKLRKSDHSMILRLQLLTLKKVDGPNEPKRTVCYKAMSECFLHLVVYFNSIEFICINSLEQALHHHRPIVGYQGLVQNFISKSIKTVTFYYRHKVQMVHTIFLYIFGKV